MNSNLEIALRNFLKQHHNPSISILLGLSGGPDSLCLFYLLKKLGITFEVAHVDHGWRNESAEEALALSLICQKYAIPFHLRRLEPSLLKGNLEESCRLERLDFFRSLCKKHGFQAIVTGHHADDLAETVLKRFFEGASLSNLSGMSFVSEYNGLSIWRPFLNCRKTEIQDWIESQGVKAFFDTTNIDEKYLRSRCRSSIFPLLSQKFGKEIFPNLARISKESHNLHAYLNRKIAPFQSSIHESDLGLLLDLSENIPTEVIEIQHLLRQVFLRMSIKYSHACIEKVAEQLLSSVANKRFEISNRVLFIDRGCLFIPKVEFSSWNRVFSLKEGTCQIDNWKIDISEISNPPNISQNWKHCIITGKAIAYIPNRSDFLLVAPACHLICSAGKSLDRWWTEHKIPAFLRRFCPVIYKENRVYHEFLSGQVMFSKENFSSWLKIEMTYKVPEDRMFS